MTAGPDREPRPAKVCTFPGGCPLALCYTGGVLIGIRVPADNQRGPQYVEQVLDALHSRNPWRRRLRLEIGRHGDEVMFYCRACRSLTETAVRQLHAAYPDARLEHLPDTALRKPQGFRLHCWRLTLRPSLGSIRRWREFTDQEQRNLADPLAGVLALMDDETLTAHAVLVLRPLRWRKHRRLAVRQAGQEDAQRGKLTRNLFSASLSLRVAAPRGQRTAARHRLADLAAAYSRFAGGAVRFRRSRLPRTCLLSTEEVAGLWHPATIQVRTPKLATVASRQLEPPAVIPTREKEAKLALLGRVAFRDRSEAFGIRLDDRRRHLAIIGKTGMGKSTLLRNLVASDIVAGRGVALIDPHGDLAEQVAAAVPRQRTNEVLYFDAGDRSRPIAFNPLVCRSMEERTLVVSGIVATFKKLYGDSWGPRLEHILRNALLTLIEQPHTSLVSLLRLLADTSYRKQLVGRVSDPVVRSFWQQEFAQWKPQLQAEAVAPIQNKVGQFVSNPVLRKILGQGRDQLNLQRVMNGGRILLVNLSKGRIGEDATTMLGSLLVTQLQLASMSRASQPEQQRRDFFAYVDEFQNFATEAFATILSESRKYRLALVIANQYLDQMDEETMQAVFGNVSSLLAFQVGARDAEVVAEQLGGDVTPADLMALPKYTAYARLSINGMPSRPFSMQTLPPMRNEQANRLPVIRRTSRHRHGRSAGDVDREIEAAFAGR